MYQQGRPSQRMWGVACPETGEAIYTVHSAPDTSPVGSKSRQIDFALRMSSVITGVGD